MAGWDAPGQDLTTLEQITENEAAAKEAEQKQIDQIDKAIQEARWLTESSKDTRRFAEIVAMVDKMTMLNDHEKRQYSDTFMEIASRVEGEFMEIASGVKENARSQRRQLVQDTFHDNNDIHEGANYWEVAEFVNDDLLGEFAENLAKLDVSSLLPPGTDDTALKLYMVQSMQERLDVSFMNEIRKDADTMTVAQWNEKYENLASEWKSIQTEWSKAMEELFQGWIDQLEGSHLKFDAMKDKMQKSIDKQFWKGSFDEFYTNIEKTHEEAKLFNWNLRLLKDVPWIDFSRTTVIDYIAELEGSIEEKDKEEHTEALLKLSNDEKYDRDASLEEKLAEINKKSDEISKEAMTVAQVIEKTGRGLSDAIIQLSNQSGLWAMFASLFKEWGPLEWLWKMLWPEFAEAVSEGNLKKQRALFNLIWLSKQWNNPIAAEDFSTMSGDDLKWFFKFMDKRGIAYDKANFWENFLKWETEDGYDDEKVLKFREEVLTKDPDFFWFEKNGDFNNDNEWFREKLNLKLSEYFKEEKQISDADAPVNTPAGQTVPAPQTKNDTANDDDKKSQKSGPR